MDEFVKMTKDDQIIEVHPLAVENHKQLGWKVVEAETPAEEKQPADEKPSATKTSRKNKPTGE